MKQPPWLAALPPKSLVHAACSGGADSVFLVHYLKEELHRHGHELTLVHINHGVRGKESDDDEVFVRSLARRLGLSFLSRSLNKEWQESRPSEEELRKERLRLLKGLARQEKARAVALGHQRDDLAESFLLMALRGSGPAGLGGPREVVYLDDGLMLLRPLLDFSRAQIEEELQRRGESWRIDHTNRDVQYRRNFLRHRVMPLLQEVEPAASQNLARSAHLCYQSHRSELRHVENVADEVVLDRSPLAMLFSVEALRAESSEGLWALFLREECRNFAAGKDREHPPLPSHAVLQEATRRLAGKGDEAHFELTHDVRLWLSNHFGMIYRALSLREALLEMRAGFPFIPLYGETLNVELKQWNTGKRTEINAGSWRFLFKLAAPGDVAREERLCAGFDATHVFGALNLDVVRPKEILCLPDGKHKSAGRAMQEAHVPAPLRDCIGGLYDEEGLLWIPGIRQDARTLAGPHTRRVLTCCVERKTIS